MQTSQAVSAGGLFTPGGVDLTPLENSAPASPPACADFEQHLQQSTEGQAELTVTLPAPAPESEVKFVAAATVNPPAPAVPAASLRDVSQLPSTVSTASQVPDQPERGGRTGGTEIETEIPPGKRDPREPEAPVLELAAAAVAAAAEVPPVVRTGITPQTPPPPVARETARDSGTNGSDGASVAGNRRPQESTGRVLTAYEGDSRKTAPGGEPVQDLRPATETGSRRGIDAARLPRSTVESGPGSTNTQPEPGRSAEPTGQPTLRQPAGESLRAPGRSVPIDQAVGKVADQPGSERLRTGRRSVVEGERRPTSEVARFQAGAEETAALNAAMFRRANLVALAGTAAAKSDHSMEKGLEQNQFAGLSEQKLPAHGRNVQAAELRPLGDRVLESVREAAFDRNDRGIQLLVDGLPGRPGSIAAAGGSTGGMEAASGSAVRTAEQLLHNLSREVAQFKRFNAESMAVVLKPDAQTEIFLHLAARNGQIEIQARFERGDFASLNGQWTVLQQTLSQQGVRLSNLQDGFNQPPPTPGGGTEWGPGQMSHGQQRQAGRDTGDGPPQPAFDELMPRNSPADPVKNPTRARTSAGRANAMLEAWA